MFIFVPMASGKFVDEHPFPIRTNHNNPFIMQN